MTAASDLGSDARPPSRITILQASGKRLTKTYARDQRGHVVKRAYDQAAEFRSTVREFHGVDGFAALLRELQGQADCCAIRAAPGRWHPARGGTVLRRQCAARELADDRGRFHKRARRGAGEVRQRRELEAGRLRRVTVLPMFEEQPTDWLLLDFEKVTLPAGMDWRADLGYAAAFLRRKLPAPFHAARCVYYATSSAADPSKPDLGGDEVRMRLGFVLERGVTFGEAKRWLAGVEGLDPSTLRPVQVIYTAAPLFRDGLRDPLGERLGVLEGEVERVAVPPLPVVVPAARGNAVRSGGPARSAEGLGLQPSPGMDAELERLAANEGASGAVRSVLQQAIFAYVKDVGHDRVDLDALVDALATAAAPYRSAPEIDGYGLENLVAWCLERADPAPPAVPHHPARGLPAKEAAAVLRREMADAVAQAQAWWAADEGTRGPAPIVGIKGGAGLGKTAAAIQEITAAERIAAIPGVEGLNVEAYVPDHTLSEELAERARAIAPRCRVVVVRGRGSADKPERALCAKVELAEQVARARLNVTTHLCRAKREDGTEEACEFATGCAYLAQFRDAAPAMRILAHAAMFVPRNRALPEPDLIVIDEAFWDKGLVHQKLALDRLVAPERWRVRPRNGETKDLLRWREIAVEGVARRVHAALLEGRDPRTVATAEECRELAAVEWDSRTAPGLTPGQPFEVQKSLWQRWRRDECNKAGRFWTLLAEEHDRPNRPIQRIELERDAAAGDGDRRHVLHLHHRRELQLAAAPVIVLDADLSRPIAEKFLPGIRIVDIPVQQVVNVVQVIDRPCSKRSLLGGKNADEADHRRAQRRRTELAKAVARLLSDGGLLVTYKEALELMELPEGVTQLHFGNLRGRDTCKNLDTAVIAGRLEPSVLDLERRVHALFGDDDEPIKTVAPDACGLTRYPTEGRRYRMAGGAAGPAVDVLVHPDPRAQAMLEQVRECELLQAIARLRLVHRTTPATVYVLTNLPLDLEVAELTTWTALARDRAAEACCRWDGVWLVSPSEQARCAPDLWPTEKAAKGDTERRNEAPNSFNVSSIAPRGFIPPYPAWGVVPLARDSATLLEYRLAGQRGRHPHRAYVPGDVWDAETAQAELEAVAGPVAKLRIVGTVHAAHPGVIVTRDEPAAPLIPLAVSLRRPRAITEDVFMVNGHVVETAIGGTNDRMLGVRIVAWPPASRVPLRKTVHGWFVSHLPPSLSLASMALPEVSVSLPSHASYDQDPGHPPLDGQGCRPRGASA